MGKREGLLTLLVDLDLAKYGLGHLAQKRLLDLTGTEIDQVLDAYANEDMAPPVFNANGDPRQIDELCGRENRNKKAATHNKRWATASSPLSVYYVMSLKCPIFLDALH